MLKLKIINDAEPLKMKVNAKFPNVIHETADLSNYYTKTETDEKLEEKQDSGPVFFINIPSQTLNEYDTSIIFTLPADFNIQLTNIINDKILDKYYKFSIQFDINRQRVTFNPSNFSSSLAGTPVISKSGKPTIINLYANMQNYKYPQNTTSYPTLYAGPLAVTLKIELSWADDVPTVTKSTYKLYANASDIITKDYLEDKVLTKTNTAPYTPTQNYHPATKQYVDGNKYTLPIATADTLGGIKLGDGLTSDENGVVSVSTEGSDTLPHLSSSNNPMSFLDITDTDATFKSAIENEITKKLDTTILPKFTYDYTYDYSQARLYKFLIYTSEKKVKTSVTDYRFNGETAMLYTTTATSGGYDFNLPTITVRGAWTNNVFKVTSIIMGYEKITTLITTSDVLTKKNTTAFTPTQDYHPATKKYVDDTIDTACGVELSGGYEDNVLSVKLLNANGEQLSKLDAEIPSSSITHYTWDKSTDEDAKMLFQSVFSAYKNGTLLDVDLEDSGKMYKLCNISQPTHIANEYWCQFRTVDWYTNGTDMVFLQTVNAVLEVNGSVVNDISVKESINQFALIREYDGTNGALPTNNTKEFVPQNDYEPATKKYVDLTHYQRISGYNSTKTQVLKNVNGTIKWVDE